MSSCLHWLTITISALFPIALILTLLAVRKGEIPEAEAWALPDDKLTALNTQQVVRFYRQPKNDRTLIRLQELVQDVQAQTQKLTKSGADGTIKPAPRGPGRCHNR